MSTVPGQPHSPTFGPTLRRIRERHRLSQSAVARGAKVDHSYIARLESGQRMPTRATLSNVADALGATDTERDALFTIAGYTVNDAATAVYTPVPGLAELARTYRRLSDNDRIEVEIALSIINRAFALDEG